jgi:uncharacterized protein YndB with AHSA1/START domain
MTAQQQLRVQKAITVACDRERAFRVFTEEIGGWWPLATHSVFTADAASCSMEARVGGRIIERGKDGRETVWGTITAWDPPRRVAFSWHPGYDEREAGDVVVRFTSEGASTRVELEHTGFERRGEGAAAIRDNYDGGWAYVFGECFAAQANA